MNRLEIKLKQHTPLIHFQHDQEGATLRASEVKPKLDRFVLTRLGQGNYQAGIAQAKTNGWLIGKGDHPALDYKMRIEAPVGQIWEMSRDTGRVNQKGKPVFDIMPLFFGNMGNEEDSNAEPKKMAFSIDSVNLTISTVNETLLEFIKENLNAFFLYHNFGTRQSKGFGSFMPESSPIAKYITSDYAKFTFKLNNAELEKWGGFYNLFSGIVFFYKTLRSGINQNGVYIKSLMYFYALDRMEYWDKRTIRYEFRHFTPDKLQDKGELADMKADGQNKKEKSRLYRDMLGLSSSQTWNSYSKDVITKEHMPAPSEDQIERFKSPILIKPIVQNGSYDVYLIPSKVPTAYLNTTFDISSKNNRSHFTMKTPKEFDVCDFLQFVTCQETYDMMTKRLNEIIEDAERERKGKAIRIAKTLLSIYNSLGYVEK
jgi:hypothetical protein